MNQQDNDGVHSLKKQQVVWQKNQPEDHVVFPFGLQQ
jgi:hypothetical protein